MKTVSIFLLLIYWSIIISAPKISNDFKFGSSRAVIIENGESGGRTAGPIAKEVLEGLLDVN